MILARGMLIICVAATALWPRAASGQDPFKALELMIGVYNTCGASCWISGAPERSGLPSRG